MIRLISRSQAGAKGKGQISHITNFTNISEITSEGWTSAQVNSSKLEPILRRLEEKIDRILRRVEAVGKETLGSSDLLQDPSRRAVFDLCDGKRSVKDIVKELRSTSRPITQPRVSQILSELENAGLVESKRGRGEDWRIKYYVRAGVRSEGSD